MPCSGIRVFLPLKCAKSHSTFKLQISCFQTTEHQHIKKSNMCSKGKGNSKTTKYYLHNFFGLPVLSVDRLSHLKQGQEIFWLHLIGFVLTNTRKHTLPWRRQQMISAQTKASLSKKTIKEYHLCTLPAHVNRPRPL